MQSVCASPLRMCGVGHLGNVERELLAAKLPQQSVELVDDEILLLTQSFTSRRAVLEHLGSGTLVL